MKEHVIITITNLALCYFRSYLNQFSIAKYIEYHTIATRHFDFSQRYLTVFVLLFNRLHSAISLADNAIEYFFPPAQGKKFIVFLLGALAQS